MSYLKQAALALVLVVSPSFAGVSTMAEGEYVSKGTWACDAGTTGTFVNELKITKGTDTVDFEETVTIKSDDGSPDQTHTGKWTAHDATAKGFFDMMIGRSTVGWGYCDKEVCQFAGDAKALDNFGTTYTFGATGVTVTGFLEETKVGKIFYKGTVAKK